MRHHLVAVLLLMTQWSCGSSAGPGPKTSAQDDATDSNSADDAPRAAARKRSGTAGWSEVQPFESSTSKGTNNRKSRILVSSDPDKHGDSLHFRFLVNNVPISGVFVAPGGQSTTFTIPVGTVHFTVDECEWETQGFELLPEEEMPIACKLTNEGDCCEVAIPVEEGPKKK